MANDSQESKMTIEKLTRENYTSWIEKIKDYILALNHDDAPEIWAAFLHDPAPTGQPHPFFDFFAFTPLIRRINAKLGGGAKGPPVRGNTNSLAGDCGNANSMRGGIATINRRNSG